MYLSIPCLPHHAYPYPPIYPAHPFTFLLNLICTHPQPTQPPFYLLAPPYTPSPLTSPVHPFTCLSNPIYPIFTPPYIPLPCHLPHPSFYLLTPPTYPYPRSNPINPTLTPPNIPLPYHLPHPPCNLLTPPYIPLPSAYPSIPVHTYLSLILSPHTNLHSICPPTLYPTAYFWGNIVIEGRLDTQGARKPTENRQHPAGRDTLTVISLLNQ